MKPSITFILVMTFCVALLAAQPVWAEASGQDVKPMMHPILQQAVLEAVKNAPNVIAEPCSNAKVSPSKDFNVLSPLKYDGSGKISEGAWTQAVKWKGCGRERTLNILTVINVPKKVLRVVNVAPGDTHADPVLQKNIPRGAQQLFETTGSTHDCKDVYVDNTKFLHEEENPNKGVKRPMWEEMWTFGACHKKIQTILTFIPNGKEVPYTMSLKKD